MPKFVYYTVNGQLQPAIIHEDNRYLGSSAAQVVSHNISDEEASKGLDWLVAQYPYKDSSPRS